MLRTSIARRADISPLRRVDVGFAGVGAAGGGGPLEGAGAGLGEGPALELLEDVVSAAQGAEIAGAGGSAFVIRAGVVEVGVPGGLAAVRVAAGLVAGGDVVADGGGGAVAGGGAVVVAATLAGVGVVGFVLEAEHGAGGGGGDDAEEGVSAYGQGGVEGGDGHGDGDPAGQRGRRAAGGGVG